MSDNPCASAVSTFPPGPTTEQEFATLTQGLVQNHSDAIIQQLKAMGVQSCKSTSDSGSVMVCSLAALGCAAASNDYQTSTGCEQISLQSQLNVALNSSTSCALNSAVNNTSVSTYQANQIQVKLVNVQLTGDLNFTGNQVNQVAGTVVNFSDSSVQMLLTNTMQSTIKNYADSLQGTANAAFSSPTAQKSISDQVSAIQNIANSSAVSQIVQSTISDVVQQNGTLIQVNGATAASLNINLQQLNVNDFVVQSITKNVLDATFGNNIATDIANASTVTQSQANTAPEHAKVSLGGLGLASGIFGLIWILFLVFIIWILIKIFRGGLGTLAGAGGGQMVRKLFIYDGIMLLFGVLMIVFGASGIGSFFIILSIIFFFIALYVYYQYRKATAITGGVAAKALLKAKQNGTYQQLMKKATSGGSLDFRKLLQGNSQQASAPTAPSGQLKLK
jgi:hypothetical protein